MVDSSFSVEGEREGPMAVTSKLAEDPVGPPREAGHARQDTVASLSLTISFCPFLFYLVVYLLGLRVSCGV